MTPTIYRDQVAELAKTDPDRAVEIADKIQDPWFAAQAWSHLTRHAPKPLRFSRKAAKAASLGKDDYQRSAVRAWEIAALAEREYHSHAQAALAEAVELAATIKHQGSRSEALVLLFQAAFKISKNDAAAIAEMIRNTCNSSHWRARRAVGDVSKMLDGAMPVREFFW
ncbi:MAG TPA: hypothetical protein PLK77_03795 [Pyrinomonadaceae bacterium]|nr:hypothetical protein [Pyrinomonadaceae bacterium]